MRSNLLCQCHLDSASTQWPCLVNCSVCPFKIFAHFLCAHKSHELYSKMIDMQIAYAWCLTMRNGRSCQSFVFKVSTSSPEGQVTAVHVVFDNPDSLPETPNTGDNRIKLHECPLSISVFSSSLNWLVHSRLQGKVVGLHLMMQLYSDRMCFKLT